MKSFVTHTTTQPTVESLTDYYPFGMAMPGRSYNASDYRFGYTGHEKEGDLAEGVYTTQYRLLDTRLGRWLSVDPLFGKYPDMGAYNYCGGNPVGCWDPDGRMVKPRSKQEFDIVNYSLSKDESRYLQLDENGYVDKKLLNKGAKSMSQVGGNYNALLELVNSDKVIEIATVESYQTSAGTQTFNPIIYESEAEFYYSMDKDQGTLDPEDMTFDVYISQYSYQTEKEFIGKLGSTVYKNNENPSMGKALCGDIEVYLNQDIMMYGKDGLREITKTLAHELYGHALFRIQGRPSSHGKILSTDPNDEGSNWELEQQIENRSNEAEQNFNSH